MVQVKCLASGSTGNSYALDDGKSVLLLEAGISAKRILEGYFPLLPRVTGCLITHEHMDHAKGVKDLAARGIDLYASSGTFSNINGIRHSYRKHTIRAGEQFPLGSWLIVPWQAQHDAQEPLGFLLYSKAQKEKVLFATDTYYIPNTFTDLNVILVECNYDLQILEKRIQNGQVVPSMVRRLLQSHFNVEHVKEFLRSNDLSKVRQIYLIHVSKGNGDPAVFQKEIMALTGRPVMVFG